jgi:cellulose synthase/poly-beta-1,6-N-acetylglucosamine synthase-like glycosyltransferase
MEFNRGKQLVKSIGMVLIALAWILLALYGVIILVSSSRLRISKSLGGSKDACEPVSVVVAMRNEAQHADRFLRSILVQDYPADLFEVMVVDDHSEDDTAVIVNRFSSSGVQLLQLQPGEGQGKKTAISKGILCARHENIIVTDTDCVFHPNWLKSLVACREKSDAVMVVAPVMLIEKKTLFNVFQTLDFIALQGMTMFGVKTGMLNMCNGANLMYKRSAFNQVNGFQGIDQIATGDDMLLMEKFSEAFPGKISYCFEKEAIVETAAPETIRAFMQQRIRWAGKATVYKSPSIKATLLLVYMMNLMLCILLVASFFNSVFFLPWLALTCSKTIIELPFMYRTANFFNRQKLLWYFLPIQPLHHIYIVIAGLFGLVGKVDWKGRRV